MRTDLERCRDNLRAIRVRTRRNIELAMQIQDVPDRLRVLDELRNFLKSTDREWQQLNRDIRLEALLSAKPAATAVRLQPAARNARTVTRSTTPSGYMTRALGI